MINKLNEKMQDFGSIPNPEVWEGIEAALDRQRKKRRLLWIFLPTAAAAIVIALLLAIQPSAGPAKAKSIQAKTPDKAGRMISKPQQESAHAGISSGPAGNKTTKKNSKINQFPGSTTGNPEQDLPADREKDTSVIYYASSFTDTIHDPRADSLTQEPATVAADSVAADPTLADTPVSGFEPGKDSVQQAASRWSFSLQAGTWDALNNRDELISESSASESLDAAGTSSFVPPQTITVLNSDTVSVLKPLSLRANVAFTGQKGWTYAVGLNFDRMHSFYNTKETYFTSAGVNFGFGKEFSLSERFSLLPVFLVNYDRFLHEKAYAAPVTTAYVAKPVRGQQLSFQLEMQVAFRLTEKQSVFLTPATKYYAFQSLSTINGPILRRDWWNGLHVGWKYTF
ncbi:MAG: hypothetical protein ACO1O6_03190 [Bacteroidota bacterium]